MINDYVLKNSFFADYLIFGETTIKMFVLLPL